MDTRKLDQMKNKTHHFIDRLFDSTEEVLDGVEDKSANTRKKSTEYWRAMKAEGQELKKEISDTIDDIKSRFPNSSNFATKKEVTALKKRLADLEKRLVKDEADLHDKLDV